VDAFLPSVGSSEIYPTLAVPKFQLSLVSTNARANPRVRSEAPNGFLAPPDCRDEKLIKVGPLEVPKRDNSREKLQLERRIGNAMFASARTDVWDHSDFATPSISSSRFASL
jgi:hypothetical protein